MNKKIKQVLLHIDANPEIETKLLHNGDGRQTWLISGQLPWDVGNAVVKIVDERFVNEINFYKSDLLIEYHPEVYLADCDNHFVVMEKVEPCKTWDNNSLKEAISLMADMHSVNWGCEDVPGWLPIIDSVAESRIKSFYSAMESEIPFLDPYIETLKKGAEKVIADFPKVAKTLQTIIHGDFMYVNMGKGKTGLVLYDWSNVKLAPVTLDMCYALEYFTEVFGNVIDKRSMIAYYVEQMKRKDIYIDIEQFKSDYTLTYLYQCLFSYIPGYVRNNRIGALETKVPMVCEMIKNL